MQYQDARSLLNFTLNSLDSNSEEPEDLDEYLEKLRFFFSENLLLAALDLIDRENVVKVATPWGYSHFQVLGSTSSYTVFPGASSELHSPPAFCTCPAYAYSVLLSSSEFMCKHLLAAAIAVKMSRCIERTVTKGDLADVVVRQHA